MNLRHIKYFLAVAEHQGFSKAAAALYVSQPALSQQVKLLEESLGVQLFDRSGRNVRLTDAGEVYLQYVQNAFKNLDEGKRAIHDVENLSRGSLRIAVTPTFTSYLIAPLVAEFYSSFPKITLHIQEISQEKIEELLLKDEIDIGIAFEDGQSTEIESLALFNEDLAVVLSNNHPLAKESSLTFSDLAPEALILLNSSFATRKQIDYAFREAALHPNIQMETSSISAILEIIQRIPLATILPAAISDQNKNLVSITLKKQQIKRTAVLMQRKGGWQTAASKMFVKVTQEFVQKYFKFF